MTSTKTLPHILVVDDDREIARLVRAYLEQNGYHVTTAFDGATALQAIQHEKLDLVVLDLMLPDQDGWDITRLLRGDTRYSSLPIIMLTARVDDMDKILGLELGADDYITKPFNPREVVARVRSVLRRTKNGMSNAQTTHLKRDGLVIDVGRHEVLLHGEIISVTQTEFKILHILMENPGYAFTRAELVERALGYEYEGLERTLDSHIKNLRKKIEPDPKEPTYIQTVFGVGYRLG